MRIEPKEPVLRHYHLVMRFSTHHATMEGCETPEMIQKRIDELLSEFPTFRMQVIYRPESKDITNQFNIVPPQMRQP